MKAHQSQWSMLQTAVRNQRIPQALLFVGPAHCGLQDFVTTFMQLVLCDQQQNEPCLHCLDCRMNGTLEHPDVCWIKPEKSTSAIKIDQIRELQESVYLTPQRKRHRIVVIEAADRMNTAAANALLKILEEPAPHTIFILLAQQVSTILPTIISRCQFFRFQAIEESHKTLLALAEHYAPESERAILLQQATTILAGLIELIDGKQHPSYIASQWAKYEIGHLLWFLYLVFAQLQYLKINEKVEENPHQLQLLQLANLLNPLKIFTQIDKINTILRKLSHNININSTLALEDFLSSLRP
ncbi:MAG: DNA polymerase III subunit delta' [Legionella sp.]|nr:MAG: DNA polymerase III subunit delta' [Legionella sp.]